MKYKSSCSNVEVEPNFRPPNILEAIKQVFWFYNRNLIFKEKNYRMRLC